MLRAIRPAGGLRFGLCALSAVIALAAIGSDPADARGRRKHHHRVAAASGYSPPYADLVMDANTGAVLHAELGVRPNQMTLDGLLAQEQLLRDLLI